MYSARSTSAGVTGVPLTFTRAGSGPTVNTMRFPSGRSFRTIELLGVSGQTSSPRASYPGAMARTWCRSLGPVN